MLVTRNWLHDSLQRSHGVVGIIVDIRNKMVFDSEPLVDVPLLESPFGLAATLNFCSLTLKNFSAVATHMMNICVKFH